MSRPLLPPKPKINPIQSTLTPKTCKSMTMTEEKCKVIPSNALMKLSLTTLLSESQCMKGVIYSPPSLTTIPSLLPNNELRCSTNMANILNKPLQPKYMQSHGVNKRITSPPTQNLLERMGLGSQTLMIRLRLPLRVCPSPTQTYSCSDLSQTPKEACSSALPMRKVMSMATMCGIGKNPEVGHLGETMRRDPFQLSTKLTSCKTSIPSTSSEPSKVWNPSKESQTSHLSYGKTFLLTDKSTLVSWLRTVVGTILVPCANRLYGLGLTLWTYHAHYESRILQSGCFFDRISGSTPEPAIDIS